MPPSDYASDCASPRSRRVSTIAAWGDGRSMPDRLYGDFVVYPDTRWPNPTAQSGCCRSLPRACGEARNGRLNGTSAAQPLGSGRQKRGKRRDIFATLQAADHLDRSIHFLGGQAIGGERAELRFQLPPTDVRFVTRKLDGSTKRPPVGQLDRHLMAHALFIEPSQLGRWVLFDPNPFEQRLHRLGEAARRRYTSPA